MLRGSGELQLEQISLFCSYVTTGLQEKDLEAVWRSNSTLVVCFGPSWRFDVVLHSGSPHAVSTGMKVGLPQLYMCRSVLDKKKEDAAVGYLEYNQMKV